MDRYTVESNDLYDMEKVPDGMWVLFDDVQAAIRAAVAAEREQCAKLCDDSNIFDYQDPGGFFAALIRGPGA